MYLTQTTKSVLVTAAAVILAVVFGVGLVKLTDPMWGHTLANAAPLGFFVVAKLLFVMSYVLFAIQGFRTHWGWGCAEPSLACVGACVFVRPPETSEGACDYLGVWTCSGAVDAAVAEDWSNVASHSVQRIVRATPPTLRRRLADLLCRGQMRARVQFEGGGADFVGN